MQTTRRKFIAAAGLGTFASLSSFLVNANENKVPVHPLFKQGEYQKINAKERRFHISAGCNEVLNTQVAENVFPADPAASVTHLESGNLLEIWKEAGVTDLWLNPYGAGVWRYDWKELDKAVDRAKSFGLAVHLITVPFGHPGQQGSVPRNWKPAHRFQGHKKWGVSCHSPADLECIDSVRKIADHYGTCNLFLDDDYRFADTPYEIGGCICPECKADLIRKTGFSESQWKELLDDLRNNRDTSAVRLYVDYFCDRLTDLFRKTEKASPEVDLGIMVMGMGSERAGIRLDDYRGKLFRVGEWMFTDKQYNSTKNKTIELFSSLFHRRFVSPGKAFSETTIIPVLSAENYTSKLSISTFSEVRNTMFMCPIPADYWTKIAPRMKKEAEYHRILLDQNASGPFKHFWGKADRYMPGYSAYSLFLAAGVPFEVCDELPKDGWTFLGDSSAAEMDRGGLISPGTQCIARTNSASRRFMRVDETFESIFKFRRTLLDEFRARNIPYIEEETPIVLGWYPNAHAVLLWNVTYTKKTIHLRKGEKTIPLSIGPLDSAMLIENPDGTFKKV